MFLKLKSGLLTWKNQRCPKPVYIKGVAVELVEAYKYLGVVWDSKLNWKENINSVLRKTVGHQVALSLLRSFGVNSIFFFLSAWVGIFQNLAEGGWRRL